MNQASAPRGQAFPTCRPWFIRWILLPNNGHTPAVRSRHQSHKAMNSKNMTSNRNHEVIIVLLLSLVPQALYQGHYIANTTPKSRRRLKKVCFHLKIPGNS